MSDRELFESWLVNERQYTPCDLSKSNGVYASHVVQIQWTAWQAQADQIESLRAELEAERARVAELEQSRAEIKAGVLERWVNGTTSHARAKRLTEGMKAGYMNALADALDEAARIRATAKASGY